MIKEPILVEVTNPPASGGLPPIFVKGGRLYANVLVNGHESPDKAMDFTILDIHGEWVELQSMQSGRPFWCIPVSLPFVWRRYAATLAEPASAKVTKKKK